MTKNGSKNGKNESNYKKIVSYQTKTGKGGREALAAAAANNAAAQAGASAMPLSLAQV